MNILALSYILASSIQILAGIPQVVKVVKARDAGSLSFSSWAMWGMTQGICLMYSISTGNPILYGMATLWMLFYATMVGVIAYFRWPERFQRFRIMRRNRFGLETVAIDEELPTPIH